MRSIKTSRIGGAAVVAAVAGMLYAVPAFAQTGVRVPAPYGQFNGTASVSADWHGGTTSVNTNASGTMSPGMRAYNQGSTSPMMRGTPMMRPNITGVVSAVSGTMLSVQSRGFGASATTTYSVNASGATVYKDGATSTLSSVAVGDRIFIQGTVSGTNVIATTIHDGPAYKNGTDYGMMNGRFSSFKGNGQPVVAGTVSTVNGTTLVIATENNTNYSIDAASSTVVKTDATSTLSAVSVGDYIVVQGAINGNSVIATSILDDQGPMRGQNGSATSTTGFFGAIGSFFRRLFGF